MAKKRRNQQKKNNQSNAPLRKDTWNDKIQLKTVSQARQDMNSWKTAQRSALSVDMPRRSRIQQLYDNILLDAFLTSQIENRKKQITPYWPYYTHCR